MFGNLTIGLLIGAGFGVWVYTKMMNKSGNNLKESVTIAVIAGAVAVLLITSILGFIPSN